MRVAGFGFRNEATMDSLVSALQLAGGRDGIASCATASSKSGAPCFVAMTRDLGLPVVSVPDADLAMAPVQSCSDASENAFRTGSVSEAAALLAAGPGARLLAPRAISADRMATCAIAEREDP